MKTLDAISGFLGRHKVTALVLGGFLSVTTGAAYWLANGGAVAFLTSMRALNDPEIARTLQGLPNYHGRVESALSRVEERLAGQESAMLQLADVLEAYRVRTEAVVDWAPEHSQRLTAAAGGCYAGQQDCPVFFRGRRTQEGAACVLSAARPRLLLLDGREYPTRFSEGFETIQLNTEFQTVEVRIRVPNFIPPGLAGVIVLTLYADCPFAGENEIVERETFRLLVDIREAP